MKASGLIVEYNPFHHGHLHHYQRAKAISEAPCMVAIMSGNFLQRGEPAIVDKWHRTKMALQSGIDLVLELPFVFAVQHSDYFAKGAVLTLAAIGVQSICFGSEHGDIQPFYAVYDTIQERQADYHQFVKEALQLGHSYPQANRLAYERLGIKDANFDLSKPNNILGYSYVKTIHDYKVDIKPCTIKRKHANYHDSHIDHHIASATSIRNSIFSNGAILEEAKSALPKCSVQLLNRYKQEAGMWHEWDSYFPYLQYRISTMSKQELKHIQGMEEGLENKLKQTILKAQTFTQWMNIVKSKRYTWTRLQRIMVNILTNTTKEELKMIKEIDKIPYVRVLGMTPTGKNYLHQIKKQMDVPLITQIHKHSHPYLTIEERVMDSYYAIIPPNKKQSIRKKEFQPPLMTH
ncbi:nucleotidyltransferase [Pontibacillus litoralis]|uniref:tRNA(Met) cytidine acetate ligase n=1 Tax=Pontibacillus litoralis JSM 072002 TaxID=1385512 RepID=A0A0A5HY77_9BACI|nr:nucleotidyltransferase [Pontibacillus litoralis]KGX88557.1 hypothetical protein N784_07760 [Pontibacillus litoralis JSM 072002]